MLRSAYFLFSLILLTSCSIYSSAGRKQFEENASTYVQSFSLQSCRKLSAVETWVKEEFPSSTYELVEMGPEYEVWEKITEDNQIEISVFSTTERNLVESCIYKFQSPQVWQTHKEAFLSELSLKAPNID